MIPENTHSLRKLLPSLSLSLSIKKKRERGGGWGIKTFLLDVINARDFPRWRMGGGGHLSVQLNRRKAQGRMQEQTVPGGPASCVLQGRRTHGAQQKWREGERKRETQAIVKILASHARDLPGGTQGATARIGLPAGDGGWAWGGGW